MRRRSAIPHIAIVGLALGLWLIAPVVGAGEIDASRTYHDQWDRAAAHPANLPAGPCDSVVRSATALAEAGLELPTLPSALFDFNPIGVTCASTYDAGDGWRVRGVFVELGNARGTAAVLAMIHSQESRGEWQL